MTRRILNEEELGQQAELRNRLLDVQRLSGKSNHQMGLEIGIHPMTYATFMHRGVPVDSKRFILIERYVNEELAKLEGK